MIGLLAVSLAGCADDDGLRGQEVTLGGGEVPVDGSATRSLSCGERAHIAVDLQDEENGRLTVTVKDGGAVPVYSQEFDAGAGGGEDDLAGNAGRWTVTVHRSLELDPDFTVTLTC